MDIIGNKYKVDSSNLLGEGGFSEVYLGKDMESNQYIAIKKVSLFQKNLKNENLMEKLKLEVELMQKMDHPNIVKYYDVVKMHDYWYIIIEFCDAGTLEDIIKFNEEKSRKYADFNREVNTFYYLNQLRDALLYIRHQGYTHRDIKPSNILLKRSDYDNNIHKDYHNLYEQLYQCISKNINYQNNKIIVKLADFGLAKYYTEKEGKMMITICGSPLYMAPELIMNKEYNSKADLWSYGIIMYQMLYGIHPNNASTFSELIKNLKHKDIDFRSNQKFTTHCYDLLSGLLDKDFKKRINWDGFFNHKWFQYWKNPNNKYYCNTDSTLNVYNEIEIKQTENNVSSLGFSNLSRMNLDNYYPRSYKQQIDYPSSYPPTESFKNKQVSFSHSGSYKISSFSQKSRIFKNSINKDSEINQKSSGSDIFDLSGTFDV